MAALNQTAPLALVAAVAKNGVIGAGGGLAWRIADDLKWFKKVTMGKPAVMGRKTFQSIGKPLAGRDNIIVTRRPEFSADGVFAALDIDAALALAAECAKKRGAEEICVIGGGEIYAQTLARADRIYLTRVDAQVEGDVFFPKLDSRDWAERRESGCEKSERNQYACEFFILDRRVGKEEKAP